MANYQTSLASNPDATPVVFNRSGKGAGYSRVLSDSVVLTGTFATNDTVELCDIESNAVINELVIQVDDLGAATTDLVVGIRKLDGTVVDADLFQTTLSAATAIARTDIRYAVLDHNTTGQRLYELLGLTEVDVDNPTYELYITLTTVTTPTTDPDISFEVTFTAD